MHLPGEKRALAVRLEEQVCQFIGRCFLFALPDTLCNLFVGRSRLCEVGADYQFGYNRYCLADICHISWDYLLQVGRALLATKAKSARPPLVDL